MLFCGISLSKFQYPHFVSQIAPGFLVQVMFPDAAQLSFPVERIEAAGLSGRWTSSERGPGDDDHRGGTFMAGDRCCDDAWGDLSALIDVARAVVFTIRLDAFIYASRAFAGAACEMEALAPLAFEIYLNLIVVHAFLVNVHKMEYHLEAVVSGFGSDGDRLSCDGWLLAVEALLHEQLRRSADFHTSSSWQDIVSQHPGSVVIERRPEWGA